VIAEVAAIARRATAPESRIPACCLPHLFMVSEYMGSGDPTRQILSAHANLLERIAEDLQRYALKHDALRRYLTSEEERRASQIALLRWLGIAA